MDGAARRVKQGGPIAIGLGVLTPGVRSAVVPACGSAAPPLRISPGPVLGSAADIALHFALGYLGAELLELARADVTAPHRGRACDPRIGCLARDRASKAPVAGASDRCMGAGDVPGVLVLGSTRHA